MDVQCFNASTHPKIEETVLHFLEASDLETATESSIRTAAGDRLGLDLSGVSERLFVRGIVDSFLLSTAEAILNTTPSHLNKDEDDVNPRYGIENEKKNQLPEQLGCGSVGLRYDGQVICELADNRRGSIYDSKGSAFLSIRDFSIEDGNMPEADRECEPEIDDSKRTIWSPDEDVVLVRSWTTFSTDQVIVNDQKDQIPWKRVTEYYNKHRPSGTVPRYWKRLKLRYYKFMPMVNEFSANYNDLYTHRQSGWSDENVLENTLYMWKANNNNKDFKYVHVWRVLKEYEKYAPQSVSSDHTSKKARTSESEGHTYTSNPDISVDADDCEVCIRPTGQKATKRKDRSKVRESDKVELNIVKDWQDSREYQLQKMVLREAEVLHKDYEILMKDTSEMTPEQLRIHEKIAEKIKQRLDLM